MQLLVPGAPKKLHRNQSETLPPVMTSLAPSSTIVDALSLYEKGPGHADAEGDPTDQGKPGRDSTTSGSLTDSALVFACRYIMVSRSCGANENVVILSAVELIPGTLPAIRICVAATSAC